MSLLVLETLKEISHLMKQNYNLPNHYFVINMSNYKNYDEAQKLNELENLKNLAMTSNVHVIYI
jgi:hypothetical protein